MANVLTNLMAVVFNTPLFYLICFFLVVGYMYCVVRKESRELLSHDAPAVARASARPAVNGRCERCERQTRQIKIVPLANGSMQLCQKCFKRFPVRRPVRR